MGSARGASQNFRCREGKHSEKNYLAKIIENFLENLQKNSKNFSKILKHLKKFGKI